MARDASDNTNVKTSEESPLKVLMLIYARVIRILIGILVTNCWRSFQPEMLAAASDKEMNGDVPKMLLARQPPLVCHIPRVCYILKPL